MNIPDRLTNVFRQVFADDSIVLRDDMTADDVEGWDSFSHINLILAVELEFGIEFKQSEVLAFDNISDLLCAIQSHMAES